MKILGLEVETLEKPLYVNSPLGTRVSVDQIFRDCELEISRILLTVDLRVMDISDFDVILAMDCLTAHRVVIDCDIRRITAYTCDVGASINTPNIRNSAPIIEELDWGGQDALNTCENSFFGPHLGLGRQKYVVRLRQTPDVEPPY